MFPDEFPWGQLEVLVGTHLKTLVEVNPFVVNRLESDDLVLTISTGWERRISRRVFRRGWHRLALGDEVSRIEIDQMEKKQGTYIVAVLAKMPMIDFAYDPLRVYAKLQLGPRAPKAPQHGVAAFVEWAARGENCPFVDAEKKALWSSTAAGCSRIQDWETLDSVLADLIARFADSKLRSVPRRLRRAAREFVGTG